MRRLLLILLMMCIILTGCNKELVTHRTVEKMNETVKNDYYETEFTNLDGRTVIKVRKDQNDGIFKCNVKLTCGSVKVRYIDSNDKEIILFTINEDENIDEDYGYITANDKGYLIIETEKIASGKIHISWN